MPDWPIWVWVVIAVVVLAIIIAIVIAATRGSKGARIERAEQLRAKAHEDDRIVSARKDRTDGLSARAEAVRDEARSEGQRADDLRMEAAAAEERSARAAEAAELDDDQARHSREKLDEAVQERDQKLRKADELDPRRDGHEDHHLEGDVPGDAERHRTDPGGSPLGRDNRS